MPIVPDPGSEDNSTTTNDDRTNPIADAVVATKQHFASYDRVPPQNEVVRYSTMAYLEALDPTSPPAPETIETQLLACVNAVVKVVNAKTSIAQEKLPLQRTLTYWQVAQVLLRLHHVKRITPNAKNTDREYDLLSMYVAEGTAEGTHTTSEDDIRTAARRYNTQLTLKEFNEVLAVLREDSPRVHKCTLRDLVPLANGAFFYGHVDETVEIAGRQFRFKAKSLHPFDPDLVFTTKAAVAFNAAATNPIITHPTDGDWDVESWLLDLFDQDDEMTELIWEIIGATLRPYVSWNKSAWFYSEQGNNGKGTICALIRNVLGSGAHTSIPLSDFGKDFALEPLVRANAIIVDENDVGAYIDKAANLKAVVTGDIIQINRKYRMPIAFEWDGFMVQCLNEFPRVKDKSESFYRRQLFVPFTKSFTGREKKYIKDDYLQRREVLEYIAKRVLVDMNYYNLSTPGPTEAMLAEYKDYNDPVRAFWEEFRLRFAWDLLPFTFLFALYSAWMNDVNPSGSPIGIQKFTDDLISIVREDDLWHCPGKRHKVRPGQKMSAPEPLIAEYDLKKWMNPNYKGPDPRKIGQPKLLDSYRGLLRSTGAAAASTDDTTEED